MLKAKGLAKLEQSGGVQLKLQDARNAGTWQCELCSRVCRTKAALAVHQALMHGRHAASHYAAGAMCQVCGSYWWTTSRLRAHVWRSLDCSRTYAHADLGVPQQFEVVGHRRELAWRPPVPAMGPAPWWSTLRPSGDPPCDAVTLSCDDGLQALAAECGSDSFEEWARKALSWASSHADVPCPDIGKFEHPWMGALLALCQLRERQYRTSELEAGGFLCTADGRNIWLCPV